MNNEHKILLFEVVDIPFVVLYVGETTKRGLLIYTLHGFDILKSKHYKIQILKKEKSFFLDAFGFLIF